MNKVFSGNSESSSIFMSLSWFGGGLTLNNPWTVACQSPLFTGFSWQEYWSGLPFSSPGHLLNTGIKLRSPALQAASLPTEL